MLAGGLGEYKRERGQALAWRPARAALTQADRACAPALFPMPLLAPPVSPHLPWSLSPIFLAPPECPAVSHHVGRTLTIVKCDPVFSARRRATL